MENVKIEIVNDMVSCGQIEEKPPMPYMADGELLEFVGYQFYDQKKRLSRVYAAKYSDREELFCVTWYTKDWSLHDPERWPDTHWVFAGGMSPIEYDEGKQLAYSTYLANLSTVV